MEDIFETLSVYKTLIICGDDLETLDVSKRMRQNDHTVVYITYDTVEDDSKCVLHALTSFQELHARVLCMSYAAWYVLKDTIDEYIMDHNLLVISDVEDGNTRVIMDYILDARGRGFKNKQHEYYVIFRNLKENYELMVEQKDGEA